MHLAGVVVLYNPGRDVVENIKTYIEDLDVLYAIDNSSKNNSDVISFEKIEYIPLMENKGIAEALNIAADKAINNGYKYLVTMDQDSKFHSNGLREMKLFIENDIHRENVGIYSPFHKTAISDPVPNEAYSSPLVIMTSGNIINLNIYKKIEGFKSWMFIDCVDFEYGLNLRKHGYDIKRINTIFLEHELGNYEIKKIFGRKVICDNHGPLRRYYIVRNSFYLYDMYHDLYPEYCDAVIKEVKRSFLYATVFEKQGIKKLVFMIRGYLDYQKGIKGKYDRKHVK